MMRRVAILLLVGLAGCGTIPARDAQGAKYLDVARRYADAMIEHGRDVYGPEHSPVFASALALDPIALPADLPPIEGIRKDDRTYAGGNPMHDENLYMMLYDLADATRDARYREAADDALRYFFEHAQSPATGLFAWGEHLFWDFQREAMGGNDIHEFFRPWLLTDASYRVAPRAMKEYAVGLWLHQIADHTQGFYSRHATWSKHLPHAGNEFPRHGGFYIAQWAEAYRQTKDPVFLTAIETLAAYFERVRNPKTLAVPNRNPRSGDVVCWTLSQLSLSIDLCEAAKSVPEPLAAKMREACRKNDASFLALPHDFDDPAKGIVSTATFSLDAPPAASGYCPTWASGYGIDTNAQAAMTGYERYLQGADPAFKTLVLTTAQRYLESDPKTDIELYPGSLGDAVYLMIAAHRLTHERRYLDRACVLADMSIATFWDRGPLPRASSRKSHYETITRADTLARALVLLHGELNGKKLPTNYCDR